jgi:predicted Na+-dependent transporter
VFFLIVIVVSSLGTGRIRIPEYGWTPPLLLILYGNLLWIVTAQVCRLVRRFDDDTVALTIEVSVRNIAVALLLVHFFFEGAPEQRQVLYTCLFYGGMSFFIGIPIVLRHRRGKSPAWFWPALTRPSETERLIE